MKKIPHKNPSIDPDRIREIYDKNPFPEVLSKERDQNYPLIDYWINSANMNELPALHPEAKILVAGCGSGEEAIILSQYFSKGSIVGLDFSNPSIERARAKAKGLKLQNILFELADLTSESWTNNYGPFDFILCHAVADYVSDVPALMKNLASVLAHHGIIYMAVNSPSHPGKRIQRGFSDLGLTDNLFLDSPEERKALVTIDGLIGDNISIEDLGRASKAYLQIDIFSPIAHHYSIDKWIEIGLDAGLFFCGSMDTIFGLQRLSDDKLEPLYGLNRPELSAWIHRLCQFEGMQILFSKSKPYSRTFDHSENIRNWRPKLDPCVGILPKLNSAPESPMPITLRFQNLPDFVIHSTAYDLEVFRRCDGKTTIQEILDSISVKGNMDSLIACLFRGYQYGLLKSEN